MLTKTGHGTYDDQRMDPAKLTRGGSWADAMRPKYHVHYERQLSYRFSTHAHKYVHDLIRELQGKSVAGLQAVDTEADTPDAIAPSRAIFSGTSYAPEKLVDSEHPPLDNLDFSVSGAYSGYNWELFFHAPFTIALHLSKNGKFEDAERWFHYVFDPTDNGDGEAPQRYWKFKPFQTTDLELIQRVMVELAAGGDSETNKRTRDAITRWAANPFRPHAVARLRPTAYMLNVVMAYFDHRIAWGDSFYSQDTRESINEALQHYVSVGNLLGPRPDVVPRKGVTKAKSYAQLRADLDEFGNALVPLESEIPFDQLPVSGSNDAGEGALFSVPGQELYFCVPPNDRLLGYWDIVADRLFKIHNSLNLQGVFRQLALFDPPIDPGMLARATAAGLDVAAVLSGANQPLPLVRYQLLAQKAAELCQEVKSLGAGLLSALEKEDGEHLALLRAQHETSILSMGVAAKHVQWREAQKALEGIEVSIDNAWQRYSYYEQLLGQTEAALAAKQPKVASLSSDAQAALLAEDPGVNAGFQGGDEPEAPPPGKFSELVATDTSGEGSGRVLNKYEVEELSSLHASLTWREMGIQAEILAGGLSTIPTFGVDAHPFGAGSTISFGGQNVAASATSQSQLMRWRVEDLSYDATLNAKLAGYKRREDEWSFQSNLAVGDIRQLFKQMRAAQIREAGAHAEYQHQQTQLGFARDIEAFLQSQKTSKKSLYTYMKREVRGLYSQCFQLAFEAAKKAERALRHELGDPAATFVRFGYMSGNEGLLAGEKLYLDLKRMDMAFLELNQREYELTRHVSLVQLAPEALIRLRETGRCSFVVPEELFDLDCPGHYFRRIRSVALSLPCVTGPHQSVNATLRLLKSTIRKSAALSDVSAYARAGSEDDRFSDYFGTVQSVVTSSALSDSGLFETNLRDERYLPFEGAGTVSEWSIDLPRDVWPFDYGTISDAILSIRYTAREGGQRLQDGAVTNLKASIEQASALGSVRLFSIRQEFPDAWHKFRATTPGPDFIELSVLLEPDHYPFWSRGRLGSVPRFEIYAHSARDSNREPLLSQLSVSSTAKAGGPTDLIDGQANPNVTPLMYGRLSHVPLPAPTGKLSLFFSSTQVEELWFAVTWSSSPPSP